MPFNVRVDEVVKRCASPYLKAVWSDSNAPISIKDVRHYIAQNRFFAQPLSDRFYNGNSNHLARIAYLVKQGWSDAIEIRKITRDRWQVTDGNHRLAAAIYRNDRFIKVKFA